MENNFAKAWSHLHIWMADLILNESLDKRAEEVLDLVNEKMDELYEVYDLSCKRSPR